MKKATLVALKRNNCVRVFDFALPLIKYLAHCREVIVLPWYNAMVRVALRIISTSTTDIPIALRQCQQLRFHHEGGCAKGMDLA